MDEQNRVAAELSHSQQKNILSLMEMVKSDSKKGSALEAPSEHGDSDDRKLLVLANERRRNKPQEIHPSKAAIDKAVMSPMGLIRHRRGTPASLRFPLRSRLRPWIRRPHGRLVKGDPAGQ